MSNTLIFRVKDTVARDLVFRIFRYTNKNTIMQTLKTFTAVERKELSLTKKLNDHFDNVVLEDFTGNAYKVEHLQGEIDWLEEVIPDTIDKQQLAHWMLIKKQLEDLMVILKDNNITIIIL